MVTLLILFSDLILKAQIEVPLQIDDGGHISLNVKLNDKEEARFLLDTGAASISFRKIFSINCTLCARQGFIPAQGIMVNK